MYELHLSNFINDKDLTTFTSEYFAVKKEDVKLCHSLEEIDEHEICVIRILRDGDFPFTLQFYMHKDLAKFHEEELARFVCEKFSLCCLVTDDTINPYAWLKIDENKIYTTVMVSAQALDQQGIFIVDKVFSLDKK